MQQDWFEMQAERRRSHAAQTWIPLRAHLSRAEGEIGELGFREDALSAYSVAVPPAFRAEAEELTWGGGELSGPHGAYAFSDGSYKTADSYQVEDGVDAGVHLVLVQRHPVGDSIWHLNQDLVFALGLIEEGDTWVRPDENFVVVARRVRDSDGTTSAIHIRTDFLRDYLCARGLALRLLTYRERVSIEESAEHIGWPDGQQTVELDDGRFEGRVDAIHSGGVPAGASTAVFHVWRTDVDVGADIPVMGPETDEGTDYTHKHFTRSGPIVYRIAGEVFRSEWIEPAELSPRVRGDHVRSSTTFIVNSNGDRQSADELNDEDIGLWLWFEPAIVRDLLELRGSQLEWYTRDTGGLESEPGWTVHFGVNEAGLINVYARDVARLSEWHRRIWAARNVYPQGTLSAELALSQVEARAANTTAPERRIAELLPAVDAAASESWGFSIFRQHGIESQLLASLHRFRGFDQASLLDLARDAARLTAERIDAKALQQYAPVTKELPGTNSLKCLERALAVSVGVVRARSITGPLVCIHNLRGGSAHLPGSGLADAFALVGIDADASSYRQSVQLLTALAQTLEIIESCIRATGPQPASPAS